MYLTISKLYLLKKSTYKWTHTRQTHAILGHLWFLVSLNPPLCPSARIFSIFSAEDQGSLLGPSFLPTQPVVRESRWLHNVTPSPGGLRYLHRVCHCGAQAEQCSTCNWERATGTKRVWGSNKGDTTVTPGSIIKYINRNIVIDAEFGNIEDNHKRSYLELPLIQISHITDVKCQTLWG